MRCHPTSSTHFFSSKLQMLCYEPFLCLPLLEGISLRNPWDLASKKEAELFKWLLACLLFGKPIQQEVAKRTYGALGQAGLTHPDAIVQAGWDRLVQVLDRGHYARFDYST